MITISIVSHGHGAMVARLVSQALSIPAISRIVVTLNIPETLDVPVSERIVVLLNEIPHGFGANHNAAFRHCASDFFCVLNPDVIFLEDPFPCLMGAFGDRNVAVAAPAVVTSVGQIEDSVRHFPTLMTLAAKCIGGDDGRYMLQLGDPSFEPDWVAGMFLLFRSESFRSLRGFDEAFFLYYEDVDICARVWKNGQKVLFCPSARIVHDAQRTSRRSWRFRRWHLQSLTRYLLRYEFRPARRRSLRR